MQNWNMSLKYVRLIFGNMNIDIQKIANILQIDETLIKARLEKLQEKDKDSTVKIDLKFIATISGLSVTSISNIINKKQGTASKENHKKITALANYLQYVPLTSARLLNSTKKKSIAFVAPITGGTSTDFYIEILKGLREIANLFHYSIAIYDIAFSEEKEFYSKMPFWGMVDGLISVSSTVDSTQLHLLTDKKIPIVHINARNEIFTTPIVHSIKTSYEGFSTIVDYVLTKNQCKKPILITATPENYYQRTELINIFQNKLHANNIPFSTKQNIIITPSYSINDSIKCLTQLFSKTITCDAIFCLSDMVAIAVIAECRKRQLTIPVTGYANLPIASLFNSTTVDEQLHLLGKTAFEKMLIALEYIDVNNTLPKWEQTIVPTLPIIRT